jgi:hypothetical protein
MIIVGAGDIKLRQGGSLRDVAPTFFHLLFGRELPEIKEQLVGETLIQTD